MSKYKDQMIAYFKQQDLAGDNILSIGCEVDDRPYFKSATYKNWSTLDHDPAMKPNVVHDMNKPILNDEGEMMLGEDYFDVFDVVLALNLFDYIYDPVTCAKNLQMLLKRGGTLWATFPTVYPVHNPAGVDYLRYMPEGVDKILKNAGFEILDRHFILGNDHLVEFYLADKMHMRKGEDHRITGIIIKAKKV